MSSSKLSALCAQVVEAGWLITAVVVPLFFNAYSRRAFEADKLSLLRSIAIVMALAWLIRWFEQRGSHPPKSASLLSRPLVLPTLILIGTLFATTITSIVPRISILGSYTRLEGTATILSYVVIFLLLVMELRTRRQLDRLVLTLVLTSVPVALYAWIQNFGFDPFGAQFAVASERVFSTIGNPIYLAAYMVMMWCLTAGKLGTVLHSSEDGIKFGLASFVWTACYGLVLVLQTGAILFAGSRGPFLGWMAGLLLFVFLLALA